MPKVLVANRGEIAIRVLRSALELGWDTVAIYTDSDESHATFSREAVRLDSPADYLDVDKLVKLAQRFQCTHLHPGYGFLSESPALASALPTSIVFIGPSIDTLHISSDKLRSRALAASLNIKVAPGSSVSFLKDIHAFARTQGLPIIIKALDGGGGRGIRLVRNFEEIEEAFSRCLGESPSHRIFVEQALTGPSWKHIEVQIIGDGSGAVTHLWERECSVQRRFQKIIEVAPSGLPSSAIRMLVESSMNMARQLKYRGLGTFEYLINANTLDWVFLEINPRVQVEHTVTEEITGIDLVRSQLLLFSSLPTLTSLSLHNPPSPRGYAIQLRLTAEDPRRSFKLSPGIVNRRDIAWPSGPGVRVDTWLSNGPFSNGNCQEWTVGQEFDSLLAKVIVRGNSFEEATQRALRAIRELNIGSLTSTNRDLLAGILIHPDWPAGNVDTLWLERNTANALDIGTRFTRDFQSSICAPVTSISMSSPSVLLQPGSLFHLTLASSNNAAVLPTKHSLNLSSISENNFPMRLSGVLHTSLSPTPLEFSLSQSTSAAISTSVFELANPNDESHIASPFTGKIIDLHMALLPVKRDAAGGKPFVRKGETILILSAMKMETTVTAPYAGYVENVGKGIQHGVVVGEGMLICILRRAAALPIGKL